MHASVSLAMNAAAPKAAATELPNVLTDMMEMGRNRWMMNVHHTILMIVNIYQRPDNSVPASPAVGACVCSAGQKEGKQRTTVNDRLSVTTRGRRLHMASKC